MREEQTQRASNEVYVVKGGPAKPALRNARR